MLTGFQKNLFYSFEKFIKYFFSFCLSYLLIYICICYSKIEIFENEINGNDLFLASIAADTKGTKGKGKGKDKTKQAAQEVEVC